MTAGDLPAVTLSAGAPPFPYISVVPFSQHVSRWYLDGAEGNVPFKMRIVAENIDKELIERCVKGDQAAWKDLVLRYERLVYSVALTFCPEADDASDVFQQVWMELYEQISDLRHAEALPAWLITVTRRI